MAPAQNAEEIPDARAMATAATDAQTDAAPLIPHNQGPKRGDWRWAACMPSGNAIPIKKPSGNRAATAITMRSQVGAGRNASVAQGGTSPKRISTISSIDRRTTAEPAGPDLTAAAVDRLPRLLETSRVKRTTDRL